MKKFIEISKYLSYILRHEPQTIGLQLDQNGWAVIQDLIFSAKSKGVDLDLEVIKKVVADSEKRRFSISNDGKKIRAVQGHSAPDVKLELYAKVPPEILYHGTAARFLDSIKKQGIKPGSRHHVHLSGNENDALEVGRRHGKPAILKVNALLMHRQGFKFFQAENGTWLTDKVPADFIFCN